MQRMRSTSKKCDGMKFGLSEMRLFLKNHSLEFHKIWYENTLEHNWSIEKNCILTEEILDMPVNVQQGIIKDLSVKILLK